ncbi:meiosis-specific protein MEI4 [Electrophorus electricus]|uniref:meiosis-specific protein MEI4 n=1 Tax=Electrophorus electricus TaxID=8005 RepID=UPI0015D078F6|nr:meiosis-specific protein MEI4 [Electrophorus electricus]
MEDNVESGERKMSSDQHGGTATWYIRTAKVAIAVAIIKSKPSGRSGRQQAEYLAAELNREDETWKTKARDLKEEVLRLRQELVLTKLLSKPNNSAGAGEGGDLVKLLSQDLTEHHLSESDSGCGTGNNTQTLPLTPDLVDAHFLLLPSPSPLSSVHPSRVCFPPVGHAGSRERAISEHTRFLQNLSGLLQLDGPALALSGEGDVVWDSVLHLLSTVVDAYREAGGGRLLPQPGLLIQASQVVARVLDQRGIHQRPPVQCLGQSEDSLKELVDLLLNNSQLNKSRTQEALTECLLCLGSSGLLRPTLVRLLLSNINHLTQHLRDTCQGSSEGGQQPVDWARYENSFYLFWLLEHLSQAGRWKCGAENQDLLAQLESQVLPLSEEFPLLALYMWRVTALLDPMSAARN